MPDRELCKQCINGAELNACLTTGISQGRGTHMIISVGLKQGQGGEAFDDLSLGFGPRESLQQLLKDQAGRDHDVRTEQGVLEFLHLGLRSFNIPAQGQRPNTGINEQRHLWRDRSAL